MKIHNNVNQPLQSTDKSTGSKTGSTTAAAAATSTASVDSVSISNTSRALQLSSLGGTEAPVDTKRVEAIKTAISAGQFKVNTEVVADKVITSANQLLAHA